MPHMQSSLSKGFEVCVVYQRMQGSSAKRFQLCESARAHTHAHDILLCMRDSYFETPEIRLHANPRMFVFARWICVCVLACARVCACMHMWRARACALPT